MMRRLSAVTATALVVAGLAFTAGTATAAPTSPKCPNPAGKYPPGQCKFLTSTSSALPGAAVNVEGTGFSANCGVAVKLDTATLATLNTDAAGNYKGSVTIPTGATTGGHTLSANDMCSAFVLGTHFTVLPAAAANGSGLPFTGMVFWPLLGSGVAFVVIGGALIAAGRRRRGTATLAA